jgi:Na+/melibiose symporter-like transporter
MAYHTVFEITQKPFEWRYSAFGFIFVAIGVVCIIFGPQLARMNASKPNGLAWLFKPRFAVKPQYLGWFFVIFASFWTLVAFISTYSSYRECREAYRTGQYSVVEGTVEDFHPMPYTGHQMECFRVQTEQFCYSDYVVSPAFNQSASHGGPIRAGLPIRVAYFENEHFNAQILRLEIRSDELR